MLNFKIIILKAKSLIFPVIFSCFLLCLFLFSKNNISATKQGITLWYNSVLPTLFPFFIATELLGYTNIINSFGKFLNKIIKPIFNIPGESFFPIIMGIISGYPVGAKIVANMKEQNICSEIEAERLISFTNNAGPLFIIGTVGISMFGDTKTGFLLLFTHIAASLTVGFLFRWWKKKEETASSHISSKNSSFIKQKDISISNLGAILSSSIMNSIKSIVIIGGFIVFFSIVISILESTNLLNFFLLPLSLLNIPENYSLGITSGIIELTDGIYKISSIATKSISSNVIACSFLLGFGGLSVLLQVLSITSKAKISIKPYIIGKIMQGCFSALYTFLILKNSMFFNLDL